MDGGVLYLDVSVDTELVWVLEQKERGRREEDFMEF